MIFSSIPFLFYYLPAVLLVYYAVPAKLKNAVLLLASLLFYGWGEPRYVAIMVIAIAAGYGLGRLIEAFRGKGLSKVFLILSVVAAVAALGYFKYADFFISSFNAVTGLSVPLLKIALPIGISFYLFQIISYTADVYRGTVPAQRSIIAFGAYVASFPQLIAGPIVRYTDIAPQLESRRITLDGCALGIRRFILGLGKKVLLANVLGELCIRFKASDDKSVLFFWLYAIALTLQIYFDFSGYSDMAIGLGKLLGFDFPENFSYPYLSRSVAEFWRRWHITLGSWFRDYVYIPLGGSRVSRARWCFNILAVWALTGLWHGAAWNFVLWGLLFAAFLLIEKFWLAGHLEKSRVFSRIYVLLVVLFGFVLFDAASAGEAFRSMGAMLGLGGLPLVSAEFFYNLRSCAVLLAVSVVGATPLPRLALEKLQQRCGKAGQALLGAGEVLFLAGLFLLVAGYLADGSFQPFLYFRF